MGLPELTRCISARGDGAGAVAIRFECEDGEQRNLDFSMAALRSLAPLLLNIVQSQGEHAFGQPAALTSVRAIAPGDGIPAVVLGLNGAEIAVCFPIPGMLDQLALALARLQFDAATASRH